MESCERCYDEMTKQEYIKNKGYCKYCVSLSECEWCGDLAEKRVLDRNRQKCCFRVCNTCTTIALNHGWGGGGT